MINQIFSTKIAINTLIVGVFLSGCDTAQQTGTNKSVPENFGANADSNKITGVALNDTQLLSSWCKAAAETAAVQNKLGNQFRFLCENGAPTEIFKTLLPQQSYDGNGDPAIKILEAFKHDGKRSEVTFGVAIKIPITIKKHFDQVGPLGGDEAEQKKLIEAQGATGTSEVLESYKDDGTYHVRGWKMKNHQEKTISVSKIVIDSLTRSDQFKFEDGKTYMYTQYFLEEGSGVFATDMITAGIEVNGVSYLINVTHVIADNKGVQQVAVGEVKKTAFGVIKSMYQAAAAAK